MSKDRPLRILFVAPASSIHAWRWIDYVARAGIDICLVSLVEPAWPFPVKELHVLDPNPFKIKFPFLLWKIYWIWKKFQPDLVHVHYLTYLGWLPAVLNLQPLIITLWGSDILEADANPISHWLTHRSFQKSQLVTAVSKNLLDFAGTKGARKTQQIIFGVESEKFSPRHDRRSLREKYQIPTDAFVVLSGRAMQPFYRIEIIVEACNRLKSKIPKLFLLIRDFNRDPVSPDYYPTVMSLLEKSSVSDTSLVIGDIPYQQLNEVYNLADVMVSLPFSDGMPVCFFEAMAAGLLVVSNAHASYAETFEDRHNCLLLPSTRAEDLADTIDSIYHRQIDTEAILSAGFKTASEHDFNIEMAKIMQAYQQIKPI